MVVVVSTCVSYPEGLVLRDLGSGQVVREVFPAGTRNEMVLAVRINGADGPECSSCRPRSCRPHVERHRCSGLVVGAAGTLHINPSSVASGIDRPSFNTWKRDY